MLIIKGNNFTKIYHGIIDHLLTESVGKIRAKFVSDFTLFFALTNPSNCLVPLKKNWAWCFVEGINRLSLDPELSHLRNPGTAAQFRHSWNKKLIKEGGKFCYSYGDIFYEQINKTWLNKIRPDQREQIINIWDSSPQVLKNPRRACTLNYHFIVTEEKKLDLHVHMRTSDVANLLPYDVFHQVLLQAYIANTRNIEVGTLYFYASFFYFQKKRLETGSMRRALSNLSERDCNFEVQNLRFSNYEFDSLILLSRILEDMKNGLNSEPDLYQTFISVVKSPFIQGYGTALIYAYNQKYKLKIPINESLLYQFGVIKL